MKLQLLILLAACALLPSCAQLAGTALAFDAEGNAMFTLHRPLIHPEK